MHFAEKYINLISEGIEKHKFEETPFELYQPINSIIANGGKRLRPPGDAYPGDPARPRRGVHAAVRAPPARNPLIRELSALRGCGRRSHPF